MRHLKLIISASIALVGLLIYSFSIPEVDEEAMVDLTVEAGNEEVLEDIYFNGYLYDYSSFQLIEEGVALYEELSYLQQLDAPEDPNLYALQEKYPEFMNQVLHDRSVYDYSVLNSEDYLISSHMEWGRDNYLPDRTTIYLSALNKETNEVVSDAVKREDRIRGDNITIMGTYEEYPKVTILYNFQQWSDEGYGYTSNLIVGDYNFETKHYSESSLEHDTGEYHNQHYTPYALENNVQQLVFSRGLDGEMNDGVEFGAQQHYLFNYKNNTLTPLDQENAHYIIANNQLYAVTTNGDEVTLLRYNEAGTEVREEVVLDLEMPLEGFGDSSTWLTEVVDNQLYLASSQRSEEVNTIAPTAYQVFDLETGESLAAGEIAFNTKNEIHSSGAAINEIGQVTDF